MHPRPRVPSPAVLRQTVLALAVLDDIDLLPRNDGVDLAAGGHLSWDDVACAVGGWAALPDHPVTRLRLRVAAAVVGVLAVGGDDALMSSCHVHGEPVDAAMAGETGWAREYVPGGAVALGLGVSELGGIRSPRPLPALPSLRRRLGRRLDARWREARVDLDRLGGLVATRLERDESEGRPLVLRPMASANVVTLLGSARLREWVASGDGTGMRAVAVPVNDRGWFDLARIDPAFTNAAWSASHPLERAFDRPLLVTADQVSAPVPSGDVLAGVLADPAGATLERDLRRR